MEERTSTITEAVVVSAPGCHFCEDVTRNLESLADDHPIRIRLVDVSSEEGREIFRVHRPARPPAVLLDGRYVGSGPLSRRKLRKLLEGTR